MTGRRASRVPSRTPTENRGTRAAAHRVDGLGPHRAVKHAPVDRDHRLLDAGVPHPIPTASRHSDLSGIPLLGASASDRGGSGFDTAGKKKVVGHAAPSSQQSGPTVRAISGSGSGTITSTYTPEPDDKSSKIVFIQVMRELLDGVATKPSVIAPAFHYQDADTTGDFYHVDYVSGEKDPYYNGDNSGDFGTQGNAVATPKVAATTTDTPHYNEASFPPGKSKLLWEFRTAAFSAAGEDAGRYYGYVDWAYGKDKGAPEKTAIRATSASGPGGKFEAAVNLWNSNHGFAMPGRGGGAAGIIVGGLVGGALGAAIGGALGGGVGAAVGGLIGLAAGGLIGSEVGRKIRRRRSADDGRTPGGSVEPLDGTGQARSADPAAPRLGHRNRSAPPSGRVHLRRNPEENSAQSGLYHVSSLVADKMVHGTADERRAR